MIVSKIEIKLHFPYVVLMQYEHHTVLIPIYNTNVHKNKSTFTLNVDTYDLSDKTNCIYKKRP